ncbi:FxsB family cyclophane-forming radical SAM/SPASM peptide maturase [Allonocardiopsis opalescens]|uniref:Radical SAM core domain-containing protein n=1 Tax=Allonocardiopsis opalescens TaxID=1144618 RepID=A0A2T0QFJ9_9ACTN|nr:FxsB family cyclophane-forming radical SAM/SPASM peptide maturase [Allonocardiopsis opalescens]PRY02698.1 uncharacterized protein CLV72_1011301 [Allonocardiopsis opalescens]
MFGDRTVEWPEAVDIRELAAAGWVPVPFQEFVLKMSSRCNLACSYCYIYEMADQGWRSRPRLIDRATLDRAADRIAEHAAAHATERVRVVLHGGEPLLAGPELIDYAAARIRAALPGGVGLDLCLQTNAVLLDDAIAEVLARHRISVGVSMDGDPATHDRRRVFRNGRGSHAETAAAVRRLNGPATRGLFSGLLCTIDVDSDPVAVYESLLRFDPPAIDFSLPHGNWSQPPPGRIPGSAETPYATWLIELFDRWYRAPVRETGIRFFEEIIGLLLGGRSRVESIGLSPVAVIVIDTDGGLEQVDTLKSAYDGAAATGLNVHTHRLDAALVHPAVAVRQAGRAGLSDQCRACPLVAVCGGGYYPHRYRAGSGFRNPSVYCADLARLIRHIGENVRRDLRELKGAPG